MCCEVCTCEKMQAISWPQYFIEVPADILVIMSGVALRTSQQNISGAPPLASPGPIAPGTDDNGRGDGADTKKALDWTNFNRPIFCFWGPTRSKIA